MCNLPAFYTGFFTGLFLGGYFCLRIVRYGLDLTFLTLDIKLNIVVDVSEAFLLGGIVVDIAYKFSLSVRDRLSDKNFHAYS
jgi:hypothetical protein